METLPEELKELVSQIDLDKEIYVLLLENLLQVRDRTDKKIISKFE